MAHACNPSTPEEDHEFGASKTLLKSKQAGAGEMARQFRVHTYCSSGGLSQFPAPTSRGSHPPGTPGIWSTLRSPAHGLPLHIHIIKLNHFKM